MAWSSTVCILPTGPKNYIVKGSTDDNCNEETCSTTTAGVEEEWSVRCCADGPVDDSKWIQDEGCSVLGRSLISGCAVLN